MRRLVPRRSDARKVASRSVAKAGSLFNSSRTRSRHNLRTFLPDIVTTTLPAHVARLDAQLLWQGDVDYETRRFVYILRSVQEPRRHYVGVTSQDATSSRETPTPRSELALTARRARAGPRAESLDGGMLNRELSGVT
jgi:hypothetical protein